MKCANCASHGVLALERQSQGVKGVKRRNTKQSALSYLPSLDADRVYGAKTGSARAPRGVFAAWIPPPVCPSVHCSLCYIYIEGYVGFLLQQGMQFSTLLHLNTKEEKLLA